MVLYRDSIVKGSLYNQNFIENSKKKFCKNYNSCHTIQSTLMFHDDNTQSTITTTSKMSTTDMQKNLITKSHAS